MSGERFKVHLVDATVEIFRCFHGAPRALDAEGREVGATRAFLHTMTALLRQPDVSHVALVFDSVVAGRRREGRVPDAQLLRDQFPLAAGAARALGLVVWPMSRYQADEAISTAAQSYRQDPRVEQVVICSTDKDFAQCVEGTRVVLLDRIRKRVSDEPAVLERFGVPPAQIPELFALIGDPSDGLPGIPGWGPKSAAVVLGRFPRIEDIPDDPASWGVKVRGAERLARSLRERRREALLSRNLSVLRCDLPLVDTAPDLEWRGARRAELTRFAHAVGAEDVLARVPLWAPDGAVDARSAGE